VDVDFACDKAAVLGETTEETPCTLFRRTSCSRAGSTVRSHSFFKAPKGQQALGALLHLYGAWNDTPYCLLGTCHEWLQLGV
jgi:hypothetical protein